MDFRYVFVFVILFMTSSQLGSQSFSISFDKQSVNCSTGTVCYDVQLATDESFDFGSSNIRLFYDCSIVEYVTNSANVNHLPSSYTVSNELDQCFDATGFGTLPFEQSLSYLQIAIDFNIADPIQITGDPSTILQNLCFNLLDDTILQDPDICFDLIWVTNETNENYINSTTTINAVNTNLDIDNSSFFSLSETNNCFEDDCVNVDNPCVPIVDVDQDGVCDVGDDPDPDPTDPCNPNFTDVDGDGVCDVGDNADPDPADPCIPNFTDVDGDGVCDLGDNADPDPNDPCNPNFNSPNCTDPMVEFGLSFSEGVVDCDASTICYVIDLEAIDRAFLLGSYNLRIFYNGDLIDAIDQSPTINQSPALQNAYDLASINDMQGGDQSGNGNLSFDGNLDILDISVNYLGSNAVLIDTSKRSILFDLCFNIENRDVVGDSDTCLDLVWVTGQTQENYTAGITTVNVASSIGITADLDASVYEDLDTEKNCFEFACIEDECSVMVCNNDVQVSLDTCAIKIDPDVLLESPRAAPYTFEFYTISGDFVRQDSLFGYDNGQTYTFKARCLENSCWGSVTIEANIFPEFNAPCSCMDGEVLPPECRTSCATGRLPDGVVSLEEINAMLNQCDPTLVSNLQVRTAVIDTFCFTDTEVHEVIYSAVIARHGQKERVDILCQRYGLDNIGLDGYSFERFFRFPNDSTIECDQSITSQFLPDSILSQSNDFTNAYPYILGPHRNRIDTQIIEIDRIPIQTGIQVISEKLVAIEGVDGEPKWVMVTEVKPVFQDSIVFDTIEVEVLDEEEEFIITDKLCNAVISYSDNIFYKCGNSKSIFRLWSVYDWCNQEIKQHRTQLIELVDTQAPELILEVEGVEVPIQTINDVQTFIDPWSCSGDFKLPKLNVRDNCSSEIQVSWSSSAGQIIDGFIKDIPKNNVPVEVKAALSDKCENESIIIFNVSVLDTIKPVASCLNELVISLTTDGDQLNGLAQINAEELNRGSNDAGCDSLSYSVLRFPPNPLRPTPVGSSSISFSCTDLGNDFTVTLVVQDEARNRSSCEVNIIVQNKFDPDISCEDIVVDCGNEQLQRPEIIGDFCNDYRRSLFLTDESFVSDCRQNGMIREWYIDLNGDQVFSEGEPSCRQVVSFSDSTRFDPYTIKWPKHFNGAFQNGKRLECDQTGEVILLDNQIIELGSEQYCNTGSSDFGKPQWCSSECGLVAGSLDQDTIFTSDFCLQLINRWTVIDWCFYEANSKDTVDVNDTFEAIEDWAQGSCSGCDDGTFVDSVYFRYKEVDVDGYYTFDQLVKVNDNIAPTIFLEDIVVNTSDGSRSKDDELLCRGSAPITFEALDFCGDSDMTSEFLNWLVEYDNGRESSTSRYTGSTISFHSQEGQPGDVHSISVTVSDGCGNETTGTALVSFGDDTAPVPICIEGVTTAFMKSDGSVAVWAKDFDLGSFDNCSELTHSIVISGQDPIQYGDEGFEAQSSIDFHCENITERVELDVWIWDDSGNGDFCQVTVLISGDCNENSASVAEVSGTILTELGNAVSRVTVNLNSSEVAEYPRLLSTDDSGHYSFEANPIGNTYQIQAEKADDMLNGVSSIDLFLLQQHILGIKQLDSPYKLIAGDANQDHKISAADILDIRQVILGLKPAFRSEKSWMFISETEQFVDAQSPWPFVDKIDIPLLTEDNLGIDFIGIKIGDLNEDVVSNSSQTARVRSSELVSLTVENQVFSAGEDIHIEFLLTEDFTDVTAFQFTLEHRGLEFIEATFDDMDIHSAEHIGVHDEKLTMSWNQTNPLNAPSLFSLSFKANTTGELKDVMAMSSEITKSVFYTVSNSFPLDLAFEVPESEAKKVSLFQNYPNPFSNKTEIRFTLPQDDYIELSLFDLNGQVIKQVKGQYKHGMNTIMINRADLQISGIIYYQLRVGDYLSDAMKLVLID